MLEKILVRDYMSRHPFTLSIDASVFDAITQLLERRITSAPVVDGHGALLGVFSEIDSMEVVLDAAYNQGMMGKVGDFMTKDAFSIDDEASIVDVAEKFLATTVRAFPVVDEGEVIGMISRTDVLQALVSIK